MPKKKTVKKKVARSAATRKKTKPLLDQEESSRILHKISDAIDSGEVDLGMLCCEGKDIADDILRLTGVGYEKITLTVEVENPGELVGEDAEDHTNWSVVDLEMNGSSIYGYVLSVDVVRSGE